MTPEQLRALLAQREALNQQLAQLVGDEEQLIALQSGIVNKAVAQITVTLAPPSGEALVVVIKTTDGASLRYATHTPSAAIVSNMLSVGIQTAQEDIEARKTQILEQL